LEYRVSLEFSARLDNLTRAFSRIWPAFEHAGLPPRVRRRVELVFEELFANTVIHGYKVPQAQADDSLSGDQLVWIELRARPGEVQMIYQDAAPPFDPLHAELPSLEGDAEARAVGGLGLIMVVKVPTESRYEYVDGRNRLHLVFRE
jgi:serine/threonine-protein kinase RsbW